VTASLSRPSSRQVVRLVDRLCRRPWHAAGLLGLFTCIVFLPSVACDFVNWDDNAYVFANPLVLRGLSIGGMRDAFARPLFGFWTPLTTLSYQLDVTAFGPGPAGFHLTNVLLHSLASAVLYVTLATMTGRPRRSALAACLFAIHPLRVESVAWVAERKDVLSVFFLSLTLLAYAWYGRHPGLGSYAAVFGGMLASLLSKATLVTLPALLLVLDVWPLGRLRQTGPSTGPDACARPDGTAPGTAWWWLLAEKVPLLMLSAVFAVITLRTHADAIVPTDAAMSLLDRAAMSLHSLAWYGIKTLAPTHLHPAHDSDTVPRSGPMILGGVVMLAAMLVLSIRSARTQPAIAMGVVWFLIALVPAPGIIAQVGASPYADRFTYVPHIGLMVAIVWGCADVARQWRFPAWIPVATSAAVIATCVAADRSQIGIWKDSLTLWSRVVSLAPDSALAHNNRGMALYARGELSEAMREFEHSLSIRQSERAHCALGMALADTGRLDEALEHYTAGLALRPDSTECLNNSGVALARLGRLDEAAARFEQCLTISPDDHGARENLQMARALIAAGNRSPD